MTDSWMILTSTSNALSEKANRVFPGLVIDKQRLRESHLQKRGMPAYVAEWLLDTLVHGNGPLTQAEYVPVSGDQNVVKHKLSRGEVVKVLTPVRIEIQQKKGLLSPVAKLDLIGIDNALIPDHIVTANQDLLRQGMWGIAELSQLDDGVTVLSFRPMQASVSLDLFKQARKEFTMFEWRNLVLRSMGYNPEAFTKEEQGLLLCRLLPLVQKNMHMTELEPKATGKSYLFENISPRVRLISGGNVSPAVLFVNNANNQWELLARFAVVALDEVQTLKFERPEEIVGGLKGFLANGKLTRGGLHETSSDCSLVMLANIRLDERQNPVAGDRLVDELPKFLQETAFLNRIKGILPGWKIRKLAPECFADTVGLKADFFGDALVALRNDLSIDQMVGRRVGLVGARVYKRNLESIQSIASGLVKILYPHGDVSDQDLEKYCLQPAIAMRQLIWNQLYRLDAEYRQWDKLLDGEIR